MRRGCWWRGRHLFGLLLLQTLFPPFRLLVVGIDLQGLVRLSHRILSVLFCLVDIGAIVVVANFVGFQLAGLRVIGQRFVVIIDFHLRCCALLVNARVVRLDFERFGKVLDGLLKLLVLRGGVSVALRSDSTALSQSSPLAASAPSRASLLASLVFLLGSAEYTSVAQSARAVTRVKTKLLFMVFYWTLIFLENSKLR